MKKKNDSPDAASKPEKKPENKKTKQKKHSNPLIHKLRIKFIAMMMGVVVLFLLVVFGVQYFSSKRSMESDSLAALTNALNTANFPWTIPGSEQDLFPGDLFPGGMELPEDPNDQSGSKDSDGGKDMRGGKYQNQRDDRRIADFTNRQDRVAILIAYYNTDQSVTTRQNNIFFISAEEDVTEIVKAAVAEEETSGRLVDHNLRYMKRTLSTGTVAVAFADISNELSLLKSELIRSIWISLAVIFVMFLLSLWFSRLATRPVERAWNDQQRFVADASHELKTPLTVIRSNTDMVTRSLGNLLEDSSLGIEKDSQAAGKLRRNLHRMENVQEESNRMKELIGELLDVARGDLGQHPESFQEISFSEIVEDTLLTWESVYFEAGKTLTGQIDPEITLTGDRALLRRLVGILIDNALKYSSEKSEVVVTLRREKLRGSRKQIHLSVDNAGTPLTAEEISHLFDRFYRADSSREQIAGYGLGLSIAQGIAEAHKGQIWAEATDRGNCFHVVIP